MAVDADALARAFERAPALAGRLGREAPFPTVDAAIDRARRLLAAMSDGERTAVLGAHPRIGADPATLSAESLREQGGREEQAVLTELAALNDEYERRHGFRFVVFVAGRPKAAIVPILRDRLGRPRERELGTGLEELLAIARDRLTRQGR
ncbi:MAG: 2-oxo-4-hydroxy-4-carboxy-5-ureidoimidazoline decarboxylase [Chloroflexi bacterium]|nr:2-oxo-4-hydroxy-4-carboxy-5-ureidoimidazoline decarboxylase [Chloroflexota bacterium]